MATTEFSAPRRVLEDLVDEQHLASHKAEVARELGEALALEIEVVHVNIEATAAAYVEFLACVLKEETGLADAARALDADEGTAPIDLVHKGATHGQVGVLDEVGMCAKESLHVE